MITCHKNGVVGVGNTSSRVFIVGSFPAKDEIRPFTGRPGQILENILNSIGFSRSDVFLTNLMCHYNNTAATPDPACAMRLEKEIT